MCGIVGYIGSRPAQSIIVDGLARLEYRGYDSAGIATLNTTKGFSKTEIRRQTGKLIGLQTLLQDDPCLGVVGIGHTRWATHGAVVEKNAHPHFSDGITIVHNGIIENHHELREQLLKQDRIFRSDTDSEIIAHLIAIEKENGADLPNAVCSVLKIVRGAFALAIMDEKEPDKLICARQSVPLLVGLGEGENFIASDFPAVLPHTKRFFILEDGDIAVLSRDSVRITDTDQKPRNRAVKQIDWSARVAEKGGFKHFMRKEIHEQPRAITDTLRDRFDFISKAPKLDSVNLKALDKIDRIVIVACGTSYYAGLVGRYYLEEMARLPVSVELASEFRYLNALLSPKTLVLGISQSGETADTLAALTHAKKSGAQIAALCNVIDSSVARMCENEVGVLYTRAGPEISVASTKAFVTQVTALSLLALAIAHERGTVKTDVLLKIIESWNRLPRQMESLFEEENAIRAVAERFMNADNMLYLGRGSLYPIALEGALKMKELSYIHAEGYAAGEMKHGPIAMIDEKMPVVVLVAPGNTYEKTLSNLEEARARGGKIIAVCDKNDTQATRLADAVIHLPNCPAHLMPLLATLSLQLFAYHMADLKGLDIDQPRNLAKSVTVE